MFMSYFHSLDTYFHALAEDTVEVDACAPQRRRDIVDEVLRWHADPQQVSRRDRHRNARVTATRAARESAHPSRSGQDSSRLTGSVTREISTYTLGFVIITHTHTSGGTKGSGGCCRQEGGRWSEKSNDLDSVGLAAAPWGGRRRAVGRRRAWSGYYEPQSTCPNAKIPSRQPRTTCLMDNAWVLWIPRGH